MYGYLFYYCLLGNVLLEGICKIRGYYVVVIKFLFMLI